MSKLEFRCSIAAPQSALKFGGRIGRVTFEIPESDLEKAIGLIALQETPLRVTVEIDDGKQSKDNSEDETKGARRWPSE